ncbi:MAG: polyprenyl diphosphate synthase [Acidimicrobiia bacterium]|nr:polyprenyl diphosphate synthase [Acidimicrobiia bacterium]
MKQQLLIPLYRLYERRLLDQLDTTALPRHIGIILDGHRRYARAERMPDYTTAYRAGMAKFESVMEWAKELNIDVTGWVLSTENLKRPAEEIEPYFDVLIELFNRLPILAQRHGFRLQFIGSVDMLPSRLVEAAKKAADVCTAGDRTVTIAMGYGGRQEIVDACRDLVDSLVEDGVDPPELSQHIDKDGISAHLYTADLPDPDLVIRTSGESRLSGFLLWQSAYAEYAFVDVYWPAFRRVDFLRALRDFTRRERRFGQ